MLNLIFLHKNYIIAILVLLFLSIICQITLGVIYHKLIWETEHMSSTANKSLQQLKLKFSGCRKINEKVSNVPIFVDRFISRIKIGGLPLSLLKHLSGQLILLSVLIAGIGACMGIVNNESFISIAPFYAISFLGLYCYFAVSSLVDIPGKIKILHINLVDYLENHLASRLEQAELDMQLIQPEQKETTRTKGTAAGSPTPAGTDLNTGNNTAVNAGLNTDNHTDANPGVDAQETFTFSKDEAEELEHLLKELLL